MQVGSSIAAIGQQTRLLRHPVHTFNLRHPPYVIQPFFIAPVLPGETMKNLSLQARCLTQPIVNPLIGWWAEYYVFYVKHRDMNSPDILTALMLDASATLAAHEDWQTAGSADDYWSMWKAGAVGMNWVKACARPVIETFFRDQGRAWDSCVIDGSPAAYLDGKTWTDSLIKGSTYDATDVTIQTTETEGVPNIVTVSTRDVEAAMRQYELLRMQGLVDATYEDWLRSYGVRSAQAVVNQPELVRYVRTWSYPSSHVQPNATTPALSDVTSAVSWSTAEKADKDRYFKEPGFLIGFTCIRPKIYNASQALPAVALMNTAFTWLPAIMNGDSEISWVSIPDGSTGIFGADLTGVAQVDLKDLLLYGDQFRNYAKATTGVNGMSLAADQTVDHHEPQQAGVDALFASADATDGVRQDGIVRLSILGNQMDTSPRGSVRGRGFAG